MWVELRLFASLRAKLPPGSKGGRAQLELRPGTTLRELLGRLGVAPGPGVLVLVNGEHERDLGRELAGGDVVSVFPPTAGGRGRVREGAGVRPRARAVWRRAKIAARRSM